MIGTGKRLWLMLALIGGGASAGGYQAHAAAFASVACPPPAFAPQANRGLLLAQDEPPPGVEVAADPGIVYPTAPPPDLIPEYPPPAPGYGYVWINGYWDWTGYEWTWNSGFWAPRQADATFYAPRFVFLNGEPVYYRGYWADPYGRREYGYGWRGAPPAAWRARPSVAPTMWRTQHAEAWRRAPGAPTVWRAPVRREYMGGRPGMEPGRVERGPVPARPVGEPMRTGGVRPAEPLNRAPMGGMGHPMGGPAPHPGGPMPGPHPMMGGPAPHPAAPMPMPAPHQGAAPAAHPAPAPHRK